MTAEHPVGSQGPVPGTIWIGEFPCCPDREFYSDMPREEALQLHIAVHHPELLRR
jgi:hypothetical protein